MMQRAVISLVAVSILLGAGAALAQQSVELTVSTIDTNYHPLVNGVRRYIVGEAERPEAFKGLPEGLSESVTYFQLRLGHATLLALIDAGDKSSGLYVDTDSDGDLSDEKRIEVGGVHDQMPYMSVDVHHAGLPEGATIRVGLTGVRHGFTYRYLSVAPGSYVRGTFEIDGTAHKVALVDSNFDGRYDNFMTEETGPNPNATDLIAFGLPEDARAPNQDQQTALSPLTRTIHIGKNYYDIDVAADGTRIEFAKAELKFGAFDVECPAMGIELLSTTGVHDLSVGGPWPLPVGTYTLRGFRLEGVDEDGASWWLSGASWLGGELAQFEVREGETTTIPAGPPLVLATTVEWQGDAASINFTVTGRAGERYNGPPMRNGRPREGPKLTIIDRDGAELASGKFKYG